MMDSLLKIFYSLSNNVLNDANTYSITSIPKIDTHKLGMSSNGYPMFFIDCAEEQGATAIDSNLELITVLYNRECELVVDENNTTRGRYTIIMLSSTSPDLQEYFLDIMYLLLGKLPKHSKLETLKGEVEKIVNLFNKISQPATRSIQGLWAELLTIELASNPSYLISSWHKYGTDKFDFNDGFDKIEIKSTSKESRIHNFSLRQLNANISSNLIIVSIYAIPSGKGKSVFDLVRLLERKVNLDMIWKLTEVVADTLGKDFEKAFDIYFDFNFAIDTIMYYNGKDVPIIRSSSIPKEISNINFDCNLTGIQPIEKVNYNSALHEALLPQNNRI